VILTIIYIYYKYNDIYKDIYERKNLNRKENNLDYISINKCKLYNCNIHYYDDKTLEIKVINRLVINIYYDGYGLEYKKIINNYYLSEKRTSINRKMILKIELLENINKEIDESKEKYKTCFMHGKKLQITYKNGTIIKGRVFMPYYRIELPTFNLEKIPESDESVVNYREYLYHTIDSVKELS